MKLEQSILLNLFYCTVILDNLSGLWLENISYPLSQSRWAFGINSPAVVLRSRSTKGPTAGRDWAGVWAAQLQTHSDNQGFQSREAGGSSEIVLAQRAHSQLWSQTIPGGGALRVRGDKRVLSSRPHPRTAGPTLLLHSQLPTCESVMQACL